MATPFDVTLEHSAPFAIEVSRLRFTIYIRGQREKHISIPASCGSQQSSLFKGIQVDRLARNAGRRKHLIIGNTRFDGYFVERREGKLEETDLHQ